MRVRRKQAHCRYAEVMISFSRVVGALLSGNSNRIYMTFCSTFLQKKHFKCSEYLRGTVTTSGLTADHSGTVGGVHNNLGDDRVVPMFRAIQYSECLRILEELPQDFV